MRFLLTNSAGRGGTPGSCSETKAPPHSRSCSANFLFDVGATVSSPWARIAIVTPRFSTAPECAAASIPSARPLTVERSCSAKTKAILRAIFKPVSVAFRAPTTAHPDLYKAPTEPRTYKMGGASLIYRRRRGYCGSKIEITKMDRDAHASKIFRALLAAAGQYRVRSSADRS